MYLPDPESTSRTITLTNPGLKPWIADGYGLALEYYFNEPSSGVLSAPAHISGTSRISLDVRSE
jgi:hypothetical protein